MVEPNLVGQPDSQGGGKVNNAISNIQPSMTSAGAKDAHKKLSYFKTPRILAIILIALLAIESIALVVAVISPLDGGVSGNKAVTTNNEGKSVVSMNTSDTSSKQNTGGTSNNSGGNSNNNSNGNTSGNTGGGSNSNEVTITQQAKISRVCGDDIINTWNQIWSGVNNNTNQEMLKLAAKAKQLNGYQNDPTCQFVVFRAAISNNNVSEAEKALTALKQLNDAGFSTSDKLTYRQSISEMQSIYDSIKKYVEEGSPAGGQG